MGDACEEEAAERYRSWYLSAEEIERGSPSRRDGVGSAKEAELRVTYSSFIRDVCIRLQLPQITIATAILLCHRFYLRQSHAKNEWQTMATACVLLASKIEDTPCSLKSVVIVAYETMYRKNTDAAKRIHQEEVLAKQKALILVAETLLLSTIRFDFNIQHPYEPLKLALESLGISHKEVRQVAMSLINDTLPTTLVVQFKPHFIAAGSLFLAAKLHNVILPSQNGRVWWNAFDVAPRQLQAVIHQMTELFKKRFPCSMAPVIKPVPTSTPTDKHQMTPPPTLILAPMNEQKIKPTPTLTMMNKQQIKPTPTLTMMNKQQVKPTPTLTMMNKQQIKQTLTDKQKIKPSQIPAPMDKQMPTPNLMGKQKIKAIPAPTPTDKQRIISTSDTALRHTQSSRGNFNNSNAEASRHVPLGSSFDNKSTSWSARYEEKKYRRTYEENLYQETYEENLYRRRHINHTMDQRLEDRSYRGTCVNEAGTRDLKKRRIQEAVELPTPDYASETNCWRFGRRDSMLKQSHLGRNRR